MDKNLSERCELSFYMELYPLSHENQIIVMDITTGKIYLKKLLHTYTKEVYEELSHVHSAWIANIHACFETDEGLVVMEEWINGRTLEEALQDPAFNEEDRRKAALDLCEAMKFLHGCQPSIIHRDIKASNVMIDDTGRARLIDFNAAKIAHKEEERDTVLIGTEGYAAPEQYGFHASDERTDIYAAGKLLEIMFPSDQKVRKVIRKATRMEMQERYRNAQEMERSLKHAFGTYDVPGFRQRDPAHRALALLIYFMLVMMPFLFNTMEAHMSKAVQTVLWFLLEAVSVDLFANVTGFFEKHHFFARKSFSLQVFGYLLTALIIFIVFCIVYYSLDQIV